MTHGRRKNMSDELQLVGCGSYSLYLVLLGELQPQGSHLIAGQSEEGFPLFNILESKVEKGSFSHFC